MNNSGGSRVLIPTGIRKTIHDIKEIAAKHSDDDIYAMLQECNMDPNETAQRLLYLDTFQEVKKKRDIRKANVNNRVSEESRQRTGTQGRGFRGGRGHYYSSHVHHGAGSGVNVSARKENGVNNCMERGYNPLPTVPEKTEKKMTSSLTSSSSISVNGPTRMPNGSSNHERTPKLSSDPVAVPPLNSQNPGGAIEHEASNHRNASKSGATYPALNGPAAGYMIANSIQAASGDVINAVLEESPSVERNESLEHSQQSQLIGVSEVVAPETTTTSAVKDSSESLPAPITSILEDAISKLDMKQEKLNTCGFQAVIFPDHLQVPEEIKNGLTFGSLDFEHSVSLYNAPDSNGSLPAPELLHETEKAAKETSLSNLNVSSTAREGNDLDNQRSPPHVPENKVHLEDNISSDAAPKYDHSKQEIMFSQGGPQYPFVHMAPNYGFPFVQPMLGSQLVRCEGAEPQSGNSTVSSTSATTQTDSQPAGVGQSSIALSPPPFPVFRQPYPYYFPYAPYFPSYYLASNAQQLLGPNGLPQRSSTGNIFLSPPPTVPGTKFSVPQGKPGINAPQFGVPSGYSSYGPSPAVTSANSAGNEEIAASGLKENGVYSTVQQGEGPPLLWVPAPGREILHANSFYNPLPQGQHVTFPPPPTGIYHPPQASPATTSIPHPHL